MKFRLVENINSDSLQTGTLIEWSNKEIRKNSRKRADEVITQPHVNQPKYTGQGHIWKNNSEITKYINPTNIDDYVVHHIDGNHTNDDPGNIAIIPKNLHDCIGISWKDVQRAVGNKFIPVSLSPKDKRSKSILLVKDADVINLTKKGLLTKIFSNLRKYIQI